LHLLKDFLGRILVGGSVLAREDVRRGSVCCLLAFGLGVGLLLLLAVWVHVGQGLANDVVDFEDGQIVT
jgi:hypothetical protein